MDQAAQRGNPSMVWRSGQERRLEMVRVRVPLETVRIIDIGCGVGLYIQAFMRFSPQVFGTEIEFDRATLSHRVVPHIATAEAEALPFRNGTFDVAFLHEMIEHVRDDRQTIREAYRVTRDGGYIVIFAPNRWFPFETHGFYWKNRYIFGNIPLINYLPGFVRNRLAPHVRVYSGKNLRRLFTGLNVDIEYFTQIFPGFDRLEATSGKYGRIVRRILYALEKTPLRLFGISHFVVLKVKKKT